MNPGQFFDQKQARHILSQFFTFKLGNLAGRPDPGPKYENKKMPANLAARAKSNLFTELEET
ncbi:MAG: hypothetical protein HHJ09_10980 [Glaciimonas sp.]|nr:hypothetical protein [Glaciimonas sp.]